MLFEGRFTNYEAPRYVIFSRLLLKCYPLHPVVKHRQSVFFANEMDQVSHPYKTEGVPNIIVPCILIFTSKD
jgi:hypothetical protein